MAEEAERRKTKSVPLTTELLDYMAYMTPGDDLVLIVLKGHLLIEQLLDRIVQTIVAHGEMIDDRFGFAHKLTLARAMCWSQEMNPIWAFIGALNSLRNDVAHSLGNDKTEGRLKRALDAHETFLGPEEVKEVAGFDTADRLKHAVMQTMGFLGSYLADAAAYRMTVDEMLEARRKMKV